MKRSIEEVHKQLAGGVIMDVVNVEQAKIAEAAGAVAVMALERVPADIRAAGGISRMSDPQMIKEIQEAVSIPVMASVFCTMAEKVMSSKSVMCWRKVSIGWMSKDDSNSRVIQKVRRTLRRQRRSPSFWAILPNQYSLNFRWPLLPLTAGRRSGFANACVLSGGEMGTSEP